MPRKKPPSRICRRMTNRSERMVEIAVAPRITSPPGQATGDAGTVMPRFLPLPRRSLKPSSARPPASGRTPSPWQGEGITHPPSRPKASCLQRKTGWGEGQTRQASSARSRTSPHQKAAVIHSSTRRKAPRPLGERGWGEGAQATASPCGAERLIPSSHRPGAG